VILQNRLGLYIVRVPDPFVGLPGGASSARRTCGEAARLLAEEVAAKYDLSLADLLPENRERRISWPRHHVMAALRERGYSTESIGQLLKRDASTVSHGSRQHLQRMEWASVMKNAGTGAKDQLDLFKISAGTAGR
jgi:hypothetical protein